MPRTPPSTPQSYFLKNFNFRPSQAREAYIRAKYELGSFRLGADGKLPTVAAASSHAHGGIVFAGLLFIKLISASNLPKADSVGKSGYYCEVVLGDRSARSKVITAHYLSFSGMGVADGPSTRAHYLSFESQACKHGGPSPRWLQLLSLNAKSIQETLIIKVFDQV